MKRSVFDYGRWSLVLCLASCPFGVRGQAIIEGTVKLPPAVPETAPAARYQTKVTGTVAPPAEPSAVVFLEGNFPTPPASATRTNSPPRLEQRNYQFHPQLLAVQKGGTVEFPNFDSEYHNVLSYSKSKRFDLGRYQPGEKPPVVVFDQAGVVRLRCEIHEHMRATILVLDTPYFTRTGAGGKYRLEHLPPGQYTLKAWLDEKKIWERPVELKAGATLLADFPGP